MRLSAKDAVGMALVAFTGLVVLVRDGAPRHELAQRGAAARLDGGLATAADATRPTVFFDVNVLPTDREVAVPHRVVVVRGSRIERVGQVGDFAVPRDARRIDGDGSAYLVPDPRNPLGSIEPGTLADLVLLERDPKESADGLGHPAGAMVHGHWYGEGEIEGVLSGTRYEIAAP